MVHDGLPFALVALFIFIGVIGILSFVLWIWALIDCAMNEPDSGTNKIVWILIIVFLQAIGAAIYLLVRRPERLREQRARGGPPGASGRS